MNGWIALTAQKMGRFDVAYPAYDYLQTFFHPKLEGFTTRNPYGQGDNTVDVLTTAHLGLVALYLGNLEKGKGCRTAHSNVSYPSARHTKGIFPSLE